MRVWLLGLMSAVLLSFSASAELIKNDNPYRLLEQVAEKTFNRIETERDQIDEDPNHLKTIVKEELMPYVYNINK